MGRLSNYFADYVPSLYISFEYTLDGGDGVDCYDGTIKDVLKQLDIHLFSDDLIEIFEKIQKENPDLDWNKQVGLTIKEALYNNIGAEIEQLYISDENTGEIFIDEEEELP
jgi:hypothetical protein